MLYHKLHSFQSSDRLYHKYGDPVGMVFPDYQLQLPLLSPEILQLFQDHFAVNITWLMCIPRWDSHKKPRCRTGPVLCYYVYLET